jgi:transposase
MARGIAHPPELRAAVVAAVQGGASVRQAARQFGVNAGLVSRWVAAEPTKPWRQLLQPSHQGLTAWHN